MDEDQDISNADFWKKSGDDYVKEGKYEEAIKSYKEALEIDPNYIKAWNNLGYVYSKLGRIDEAKKCKEKIDDLKKLSLNQSQMPPSSKPVQTPSFFCNYCGSELKFREAEICPNCGMRLRDTKKIIREEKNPGIAALCSFFIPGLGQIYNGDVGKAIAIYFGTLIGFLLFFIPGVIVWIFGIYDAYTTSKKMNEGEIPYKSTNTVAMILFALIGFILMIVFFIIAAALIAAFVFGMAGSTAMTKNVGVTVAMNDLGYGVITMQGGNDLSKITDLKYSIDEGEFYPVKATSAGSSAPDATNIGIVGKSVYTGEPIKGKRLFLVASFDDETDQVIFDRKF